MGSGKGAAPSARASSGPARASRENRNESVAVGRRETKGALRSRERGGVYQRGRETAPGRLSVVCARVGHIDCDCAPAAPQRRQGTRNIRQRISKYRREAIGEGQASRRADV